MMMASMMVASLGERWPQLGKRVSGHREESVAGLPTKPREESECGTMMTY